MSQLCRIKRHRLKFPVNNQLGRERILLKERLNLKREGVANSKEREDRVLTKLSGDALLEL